MVTMNNLVQLKGKPPGYREYFENCFIVCACSCLHDQVWMQAINAFFKLSFIYFSNPCSCLTRKSYHQKCLSKSRGLFSLIRRIKNCWASTTEIFSDAFPSLLITPSLILDTKLEAKYYLYSCNLA